jgi:hypothetical protein
MATTSTIRAEIDRQAQVPKGLGIAAGLVLLPFLVALRDPWSVIHAHPVGALTLVFLPVFLPAVILMTWMTRWILCPSCRKPLGWSALRMYDRGRWSQAIDSCPHCDVDLDERMPAQPSSARSR